jgi:hypothetical protein
MRLNTLANFLKFFLFLFLVESLLAQQKVVLQRGDKVAIAEAFRLGEAIQDQIWEGWSKAPFALMLETQDHEFLFRHPHATQDFDTLGYDSDLNSKVLYRRRLFESNLLATFPAVNGVSTIVVGQMEQTKATSPAAWIVTVLHEHFHQLQQSQSDYYSATEALGLTRGDRSGMWMLNYPFPYDSAEINEACSALGRAVVEALESPSAAMPRALKLFFSARERFKLLLSRDDYRYYSFQCWQEGVARYTELQIAERAAKQFVPSGEFLSLAFAQSFQEVADSLHAALLKGLADLRLSKSRRIAFYTLGAGEALLLDRVRPDWKRYYFQDKFFLDKYFSK